MMGTVEIQQAWKVFKIFENTFALKSLIHIINYLECVSIVVEFYFNSFELLVITKNRINLIIGVVCSSVNALMFKQYKSSNILLILIYCYDFHTIKTIHFKLFKQKQILSSVSES